MNIEEQRKAFEKYYIANFHDGDIHPNQQLLEWSEEGEFYFASSVEDLWGAWLASANREGFVLVPKEPTLEMLENAANEHVLHGASYAGIYKAMIEAAQELTHE